MGNPVYTFYHRVKQLGPADALIDMWKRSWKAQGWEPVVLGLDDAKKHPLYEAFVAGIKDKAKSVNPGDYDLMCWVRWLAFHGVGGGLMTDYDVINRNFKNEDLTHTDVVVYDGTKKVEPFNDLVVYEISKVPCCVGASPDGAKAIVDGIHSMPKNNGNHYSDMYWFTEQPFNVNPLVVEFGDKNWTNAKLVHFCNSACTTWRKLQKMNVSREQLVKQFMGL